MEEYNQLDLPYYEMTYLDDNDTMHLTKVADEKAVSFMKERFTVTSCNFINA